MKGSLKDRPSTLAQLVLLALLALLARILLAAVPCLAMPTSAGKHAWLGCSQQLLAPWELMLAGWLGSLSLLLLAC